MDPGPAPGLGESIATCHLLSESLDEVGNCFAACKAGSAYAHNSGNPASESAEFVSIRYDQILGNCMQRGALFQVIGTTGLHDVLEVFGP